MNAAGPSWHGEMVVFGGLARAVETEISKDDIEGMRFVRNIDMLFGVSCFILSGPHSLSQR